MALQDADEFQASVTVDDIENLLVGLPSSSTANISNQQAEQVELALPLETAQSSSAPGTPSRPILAEVFPFRNSSSPADPDADVLPYPKPHIRKKSQNPRKLNDKFFVMTSEEAYQSKLGEAAGKIARETEKAERKKKSEARKEALARKKEEESRNKKAVMNKVTRVKHQRKVQQKRKEANWQCNGCRGFYFDSGNPRYDEDWVSCVECHKVLAVPA